MNPQTPLPEKSLRLNWSLPLFITAGNRIPAGFFLMVSAAALYLPANHFHLIPPQLLPLSWVDTFVPFMPHTVWVYLSESLFFTAVYLTCKDTLNLNKYFYSFLVLQIVSVFIFWIFPTAYPRELFPLSDSLDSVTYFVFTYLRQADTPANCCPSLHVSSVYLSSFLFLDEQKSKFPFFFSWATAIAISTLTTKQHYLVDVAAGLSLAIVMYWIFHRCVTYSDKQFYWIGERLPNSTKPVK